MENQKKLIILLVAFLLILAIILGIIIYQQNLLVQLSKSVQNDLVQDYDNKLEQSKNNNTNSTTNSNSNEIKDNSSQDSTRTNIDGTWDLYTNNVFGFSLNIPKDDNIDIIESGDVIYIVYQDSYYNQEIEKRNIKIPWAILVKSVSNDQELDQFIKDRYGKTCGLGEKTLSKQEGIYDVSIDFSNWTPGDESGCFVNYQVRIKYSPTFKKVAAWDIGQDINFILKGINCADCQMADSFKFFK